MRVPRPFILLTARPPPFPVPLSSAALTAAVHRAVPQRVAQPSIECRARVQPVEIRRQAGSFSHTAGWGFGQRQPLAKRSKVTPSDEPTNCAMNGTNWLCLDCGKNTFENNEDYYFLRNRLWRSLVAREQRHGMLCRACVERRLGRPLATEDFRNPGSGDESDPEDQPMRKEAYGIVDSLTTEMLHAIDSEIIKLASSSPRKTVSIVRHILEKSLAAIPGLPDWFYMDRIGELVEDGVLVVVTEGSDERFHVVQAADRISRGE